MAILFEMWTGNGESDGKNFFTVPKSLQAKVKAQIEEDGYTILKDGTVVKVNNEVPVEG